MHFWERVWFVESFIILFPRCWVWSFFFVQRSLPDVWFHCFLVSCYHLAKARPEVWRPPPPPPSSFTSARHGARGPSRRSSDRLLPELGKRVLLTLQLAGRKGAPSLCLSPGDVPLSGSETRLCWAVCSTQVWTLVLRPCITLYRSSVEGRWRGALNEMFPVLPVVMSYFCMLECMYMMYVCMWMWHLPRWYYFRACLGLTCPFALRNVYIHVFI